MQSTTIYNRDISVVNCFNYTTAILMGDVRHGA